MDEHEAFSSAYFLELDLPKAKLEANIPALFTASGCGRVLRVKGFVEEAGQWYELNATAEGLTVRPAGPSGPAGPSSSRGEGAGQSRTGGRSAPIKCENWPEKRSNHLRPGPGGRIINRMGPFDGQEGKLPQSPAR